TYIRRSGACRGPCRLCSLALQGLRGNAMTRRLHWTAAAGLGASLVAAITLACAAVPASAQTDPAVGFPNKPIRLIVGFAAGGGTDGMPRVYAPKLPELLGQPVVIENRTGAGGRVAAEFVQSQPPDGYTLAFGAIGQLAIANAIYPNLPFHPTRTLIPVAMV